MCIRDRSFSDCSRRFCLFLGLALILTACGSEWNDPYLTADRSANRLYSAFAERPKHLDPAVSYSDNEITFIAQIYEPPLQYQYLQRPYSLMPTTLAEMPRVTYYDKAGRSLPETVNGDQVDRTVYQLKLRAGIQYQPHPAFSRNIEGNLRYMALNLEQVRQTQSYACLLYTSDAADE